MVRIKTEEMPGWLYIPELKTKEDFLNSVTDEYYFEMFWGHVVLHFYVKDLLIETYEKSY